MPGTRVRRLGINSVDAFPVPITLFLVSGPAAMIDAVLIIKCPLAVAHVIQPLAVVSSSRRIFLRTPPAPHVVDVFSDVVISIRKFHVAVAVSVARAPRALVDASVRVEHVSKTVPQVVLPEALVFTTISIVTRTFTVPPCSPKYPTYTSPLLNQ